MLKKNFTSNTYRHAQHTHGRVCIGTNKLAGAMQHSENVAKKRYLHNSETNSAFNDYFNMVTKDAENVQNPLKSPEEGWKFEFSTNKMYPTYFINFSG